MTASQKDETASQSPSLRTMACISAGRERAPSPTTSLRTRRCSAHAGQTASVCSTVSSGLRSDDTRAFPPAQSETGTYRSFHVREPSPWLRQSLLPFRHEIVPELIPPRINLARQWSFAPATRVGAQTKDAREHLRLQIPRWESGKKFIPLRN
ncbi:hypothetical protein SFRURICE_001675 [Spodoptera frugiperda]|nr:hypothetical protein SFRURICE_001675 [Spodoptera frugiperda]